VTWTSRIADHLLRRTPGARPRTVFDARIEHGFERSVVAVGLLDVDGRCLRVNRAFCTFLGRTEEEVLGRSVLAFTHPEDHSATIEMTGRLVRRELDHFEIEKRYVRPDGSIVWGHATSTLVALEGSAPYRYVQILDVTRRKGAEVQLEALLHEHAAVARVAGAVAAGADADEIYSLVAQQVAALLDADAGAVVRFDPDDMATCVATWSVPGFGVIEPGTTWGLEEHSAAAQVYRTGIAARADDYDEGDSGIGGRLARHGARAGVAAPIHVDGRLWGAISTATSRPRALPDDAPVRLARFAELVGLAVANANERQILLERAATDPLTGLLNHGAFHERLAATLAELRERRRRAALVLLDVDHFKEINDAEGHQTGDLVLQRIAGLVAGTARPGDVLARIGGDELGWLLLDVTAEDARTLAEAAREAVRAAEIRAPGGGLLTLSAGIAGTDQASTAAELFQLADGALYWAKGHGRNTTVCYHSAVVEELSAGERAQRLERSQALGTIRALARAVDARDPNTQRHSERVGDLAAQIAVAFGWSLEAAAQLRDAGLVHDVGKIGVPDAILLKPDRLTPAEYEQVKAHAALGAQIVRDILLPDQVAWVRHHHERWDGQGYPAGIGGEEIPHGARILAVADSWDVMTSERAYHVPRSRADALAEVRRSTGTQFAPDAVAALERLVEAGLLDTIDARRAA
jgi:diguanylate cyclase (GGDEF)-like protein/PAS domain S-box-containing protein